MVVVTRTDFCIPVTYWTEATRGRFVIRYTMQSARLTFREEDVVRLALEFLYNRELHITQLSLERETGVINGNFSDDVLFLRQLILDGQWDDVLEFIQPLEALKSFNMKKFCYTILKHKYVELLCVKSEANVQGNTIDNAVEEVVKVLNELEKYSASKEEYSTLCLLLTLPRLRDHSSYQDWNPSNARVQCFREIYALVAEFLPGDQTSGDGSCALTAKNDRLIQLIIKGILYESCVNYCQTKATSSSSTLNSSSPNITNQNHNNQDAMSFSNLLDGTIGFSDSDLSLLSWLQSVPTETFSIPFEQRTLNVDVEKLQRPTLETSWTEHMLVTPIKPKTFPHSAMPFTRPRSAADMMTRSLMPVLDSSVTYNSNGLAQSVLLGGKAGRVGSGVGDMSKSSFASFHLTGLKNHKEGMNKSVDRLFEDENEVFLSNLGVGVGAGAGEFIEEVARESDVVDEVGANTRDSNEYGNNGNVKVGSGGLNASGLSGDGYSGELVREYQRSKLKLQEALAMRERERVDLLRQISGGTGGGGGGVGGVIGGRGVDADVVDRSGDVTYGGGRSGERSGDRIDCKVDLNGVGVQCGVRNQNGGAGGSFRGSSENLIKHHLQDRRASPTHTPKSDAAHHTPPTTTTTTTTSSDPNRPKFIAVTTLEDVQAIRCAEFHPNGLLYAVGSNSKTLRICAHPKLSDLNDHHATYQPTVLFKRTKHHKGSIYCLAWSPVGDLMATGSNDKTVKLMRFNGDTNNLEGDEVELAMHDGTVRDLCFLEDTSNKSSLLISGGAGDCKIYVTDCATGTPFQALSGHTGHILSLYTWGGAMFVSGSHDKTVRFWDLRTRGCVNIVTPVTVPGSRQSSPVSSLCVDPSGRLLVSGHEDSACVLYDIRGGRNVQCFKPHSADVRSVRFSPSAYYLLSAGYDNKLVLTDLQGDLTLPLPSVVVAQHQDKAISGRWHPGEFSFLSTSADKTATLWALPPV